MHGIGKRSCIGLIDITAGRVCKLPMVIIAVHWGPLILSVYMFGVKGDIILMPTDQKLSNVEPK